MKVLILKGLPASGKSTYAKELVAQGGWKRVNKDDLRAMLDNSKWSKGNENFVLQTRDSIIWHALQNNLNVVVDDTNLSPKHEEAIKTLLSVSSDSRIAFTEVEVKYFDTPVEECIRRNKLRNKKLKAAGFPEQVPDSVIWDMYNRFVKDILPQGEYKAEEESTIFYIPPKDKPKAIIVDIDGTLSHMTTRKGRPYDWHRVGEDAVDEIVADIVDR